MAKKLKRFAIASSEIGSDEIDIKFVEGSDKNDAFENYVESYGGGSTVAELDASDFIFKVVQIPE